MFGKTLIAAAVLAVAAAGTATAASAHPSHGYKRVVTVQQCIGGGKYLVRKTRSGRVISKTRVGRCHNAHRHHAHHNHHAKSNRKAKRVVKRIYRRAFNN